MTIAATMPLNDAAARTWDALIVGAGPAGSLLARQLAQFGRRVLLLDKASFPRGKVCGCCLSGAALAALRRVGLGDLPGRHGAVPLRNVVLAAGSRLASLPLPAGAALSREALDAALVREAIAAGADFLPETLVAAVSIVDAEQRHVDCRRRDGRRQVAARVVIAADGLSGQVAAEERPGMVQPQSRIGAATSAVVAPDFFQPGTIYMATNPAGYVGLVRLEDGRLDVAAALDPAEVRRQGGPGRTAARILAQTAWPAIEGLPQLSWRGTPPLTRRRTRLGAERLLIAGDAAGYVEPFTGEGIAWALDSAIALAPLVDRAVAGWNPQCVEQWSRSRRRLLGARQQSCRLVARALRSRVLTGLLIGVLARAPALAGPFLRRLNR